MTNCNSNIYLNDPHHIKKRKHSASVFFFRNFRSVAYIRQKCKMTCTLDGYRQLSLMTRTRSGHSAGNDLRSLGQVSSQTRNVFIIYLFYLINAKRTYFLMRFASVCKLVITFKFFVFIHIFAISFSHSRIISQNGRSSSSSSSLKSPVDPLEYVELFSNCG